MLNRRLLSRIASKPPICSTAKQVSIRASSLAIQRNGIFFTSRRYASSGGSGGGGFPGLGNLSFQPQRKSGDALKEFVR